MDVLYVDGHVADAQHDEPTICFDAKMTSLSELVIKSQQAIAGCVEMARVLKNMEANQVAAKERLQEHFSVFKRLIDVARGEWRVHREANPSIDVVSSHKFR